ncbi:MAG: hypothetical protein JKY86_07110 [Gammaproteobacteria bacterium]|nr:hypothetical protein [Gammaproteobacteria bacterium]
MLKLSKTLFILCFGIASQLVTAQPATFENDILNIPQGAAIVDGEPVYYNNIQLVSNIDGNFTLLAAQQSSLVSVDSIVVNIAELFPIQVSLTVTGNKSIPCVELQTPAIFQDEFMFTVALAETALGPAESCIAVLDPFETNILLNVIGLESGTYTVKVNGVQASFSL